MIACTRCGQWHTFAEEVLERRLSCTEVKVFWSQERERHRKTYGHSAEITGDETGKWICFTCKRPVGRGKE